MKRGGVGTLWIEGNGEDVVVRLAAQDTRN
jgi:hypothetical protein